MWKRAFNIAMLVSVLFNSWKLGGYYGFWLAFGVSWLLVVKFLEIKHSTYQEALNALIAKKQAGCCEGQECCKEPCKEEKPACCGKGCPEKPTGKQIHGS